MKYSTTLSILALSLVLSACGMDRTLDDYKNEKVSQDVAKIQSVSGTYRGTLTSRSDGTVIDSMSLDLMPNTRVSGDSQRAALRGKVLLGTGSTQTFILITDGYYDNFNNTFQANVPVQLSNNQNVTLDISGRFNNGKVEGSLEVLGYSDNGAIFTLEKDAPAVQTEAQRSSADIPANLMVQSTIYKGQAKYARKDAGSLPSNLEMRVLQHSRNSEQTFIQRIMPLKFANISLQIDTITIYFDNVQIDLRKGTLVAVQYGAASNNSRVGSDQIQLLLTCTAPEWNCSYFANGALSFTAKLEKVDSLAITQ